MSLKGYQWLRDDKVIMLFTFKDREVFLLTDVTEEEYNEFCKWLDENAPFKDERVLNLNDHKIIRA